MKYTFDAAVIGRLDNNNVKARAIAHVILDILQRDDADNFDMISLADSMVDYLDDSNRVYNERL